MNRFNAANIAAIRIAEELAVESNSTVTVVRDLLGRNALAMTGSDSAALDCLRARLRQECAPFVGAEPVIILDEMFAPELITHSDGLRRAPENLAPSGRVSVLERSALSSDWIGPSLGCTDGPKRVALYGFKGGVARSTATFALAQHLARQGNVVLVIDLDLESPGVSSMLSPDPTTLPENGIVDHLVEYAVGNAEDLDLTVRSASVGDLGGNGEVWLAPAAGYSKDLGDGYLDKLSRAYFNLPPDHAHGRETPVSFARRLEEAVRACENQVTERSRPVDIVLLDSRSGIHDIAAVAITQLSTLALLFATDNPQTWNGYRQLFYRWGMQFDSERRDELRRRIQMVAPLVPPTEYGTYLQRFTDRAQQCFAETLYERLR